jgi:hypothetical protein
MSKKLTARAVIQHFMTFVTVCHAKINNFRKELSIGSDLANALMPINNSLPYAKGDRSDEKDHAVIVGRRPVLDDGFGLGAVAVPGNARQ